MTRKKSYSKKAISSNNTEKRLVRIEDIKRENRIKNLNKWIGILLGIAYPLVLVLFAYTIQKGSFDKSFAFMVDNIGVTILNLLFVYGIFFVVLFISNFVWLSALLSSLLFLSFTVVSALKYAVRGEVLLVSDFSLFGKFMELASFIQVSKDMIILLCLSGISVVIGSFLLELKNYRTSRITSGIIALLITCFMLLIFVSPTHTGMLLNAFGIDSYVRYAPNIIHNRYGTNIGLYLNYKMNDVGKPDNYSQEAVFNIIKSVDESNYYYDSFGDIVYEDKGYDSEVKPNVIMVMSESFFDPYVIPNVEYSEDPIPNIRKYLKENYSGKLVTSTFAGGTSYVEFEAFTGETTEFFPYGTVPYVDLEKSIQNCSSIQKEFKSNGYKTIAMHSYERDFYNRDNAYKKLGFDEFYDILTLEKLWNYGKYVSDVSLIDNVINKLEEQKAGKIKEPLFLWTLTMQNHVPYSTNYFDKEGLVIDVKSSMLTDSSKDKLTAYVNGLVETDRSVKRLIDYLEETDTPTVLLFFGDHLPALYEVYYDTKMVKSIDTTTWTKEELAKMHTLPFFIYDNYKNEKASTNNVIGNVFLGNELLNYAEINKSIYFKFLDTLNYTALRDRLFVDKHGKIYDKPTENCMDKIQEHKLLQYDMIYGNNYISKYKKAK